MAVFLVNVCKFNSCGLKFASLPELIRHIEESHLDYEPNPKTLDTIGNATCLPVSCVLRIYSNRPEDGLASSIDLNSNTLNESHVRKSINSPAVSLGSTPTDGSELDEDADSDSGQSSIDSWATVNNNADSTTNPLMKFHQIMGSGVSGQNLDENNNSAKLLNGTAHKEFICGYSGCTKRYRSSNSLSHHKRSAHKTMNNITIIAKPAVDEQKKIFPCAQCGKTYKTSHGLKNHCNIHHSNNNQLNAPNRPQLLNGNMCNASNMAIASNAVQIKQEMPAQVTSFVQISSTKSEISPTVKETILNSISKAKGFNHVDFVKLKNGGTFPVSEIISDNNCPPVCSNVEVISESKPSIIKSPPIISAPTLQQHLLSPIIPKVASS